MGKGLGILAGALKGGGRAVRENAESNIEQKKAEALEKRKLNYARLLDLDRTNQRKVETDAKWAREDSKGGSGWYEGDYELTQSEYRDKADKSGLLDRTEYQKLKKMRGNLALESERSYEKEKMETEYGLKENLERVKNEGKENKKTAAILTLEGKNALVDLTAKLQSLNVPITEGVNSFTISNTDPNKAEIERVLTSSGFKIERKGNTENVGILMEGYNAVTGGEAGKETTYFIASYKGGTAGSGDSIEVPGSDKKKKGGLPQLIDINNNLKNMAGEKVRDPAAEFPDQMQQTPNAKVDRDPQDVAPKPGNINGEDIQDVPEGIENWDVTRVRRKGKLVPIEVNTGRELTEEEYKMWLEWQSKEVSGTEKFLKTVKDSASYK